ncbi:NAD-binding protein [Poriferisphaera sp. WC338]|uniref:NAD-binding protein n=1 Tax=Poriferisphaera sp. WC338 TaxID=3425129 RepID=UPI003D8170DF
MSELDEEASVVKTNGAADAGDRRAIVAGYGPAGRLVAAELEGSGFEVTVIDENADTVLMRLEKKKGAKYGDVLDGSVLEEAGIMSADLLVVAIPDERSAIEACRIARSMRRDLFIVARTNFLSRGMMAEQAGADEVVVEEVVTAAAMRDVIVKELENGGRLSD